MQVQYLHYIILRNNYVFFTTDSFHYYMHKNNMINQRQSLTLWDFLKILLFFFFLQLKNDQFLHKKLLFLNKTGAILSKINI